MSPVIALQDVSVSLRGLTILDRITFEVAAGESLAVLGPSGSGKSTLMRVVLGLTCPDRGEVCLMGQRASTGKHLILPVESRRLSAVFQDLALWPHLTVHNNLEFALSARGVPKPVRREAISRMLERVGLGGMESRYPSQLSGGERQRVAIARALVTEPTALLMDEPLTSLDVVLKQELLHLFGELIRERRVTVIYVSHDIHEASQLASRALILEKGRISQLASITEIKAHPATPFIERLTTS